jgi:hypothetical protein
VTQTSGLGPLRVLLIALLVGLCCCAAGGFGGYVWADRETPDFGPSSCGDSAHDCIPRLDAATVIGALRAQGHECRESAGRWTCGLQIGVTEYSLSLQAISGQVHSYSARVSTSVDGPPSKEALSYLSWLAQLPYAHDPVFAGRIDSWLIRQIEKGGRTAASVGGYGYELKARDEKVIDLAVGTAVPR